MLRAGDVLQNPVTGERVDVYVGSHDTQNRVAVVALSLAPGAAVAGEHVHPAMEEAFTVLGGRVRFRIAGREGIANIGERLLVPPGPPHGWWNAGDDAARVLVEVRPPARFEAMLTTLFAMAQHGETDGRGVPQPQSRLEASGRAFTDVVVFPGPPPVC